MNLTLGEMLFYGGIIGIVIVIVIATIVISVLAHGRKRLRRKFDNEIKTIKK